MKKIIIIAIVLMAFLPVGGNNNPVEILGGRGRLEKLEREVDFLKGKIHYLEQRVETLELGTSCMESYINFILSDDFIQIVCQECQ